MGELALIRQFLFSTLFSSFQSTTEPSWVGCPKPVGLFASLVIVGTGVNTLTAAATRKLRHKD